MAKKITKKKRKLNSKQIEPIPEKKEKVHPWRLCPSGEHWVRTHSMKVPPCKTNPAGYKTSRKDHLYPHEIEEVSEQKFSEIKLKPCSIDLGYKGRGEKYDTLIAGWVQYWNDIFKPKDPLDPDIVKALIASESGFVPDLLANKKNQNSARGLMQITNKTRVILADEKGELKEHFLTLTRKELNDPSINICAGVRWLFHKRKLASAKREATWEEVIYKYKGCDTVEPDRAKELISRFLEKLKELKKCAKK